MDTTHGRRRHPSYGPPERAAAVLVKDPWTDVVTEGEVSELNAFFEEFPGQLATVTAIDAYRPRPSRWSRIATACGRGFDYFLHSLADLTDAYDR